MTCTRACSQRKSAPSLESWARALGTTFPRMSQCNGAPRSLSRQVKERQNHTHQLKGRRERCSNTRFAIFQSVFLSWHWWGIAGKEVSCVVQKGGNVRDGSVIGSHPGKQWGQGRKWLHSVECRSVRMYREEIKQIKWFLFLGHVEKENVYQLNGRRTCFDGKCSQTKYFLKL